MATFGTQVLTDEILADLQPTLTSTTIVSFRPKDLRRSGTVAMEAFDQGEPPSHRAADSSDIADEDIFDPRVLAASNDVATERIDRSSRVTPAARAPEAEPQFPLFEPTPAGQPILGKKKPTDSFTMNPEFAQRVFQTTAVEIVDSKTGDHVAFVRGIVYRDTDERVAKVQCFLPKGQYLTSDGGKVEFRIEGKRYRVKDGFYVTPRGAGLGEWCYLGYVG